MFHTIAPTLRLLYARLLLWHGPALEEASAWSGRRCPRIRWCSTWPPARAIFLCWSRRRYPGARAVAVDLTERMLQLARRARRRLARSAPMPESLPFPDGVFRWRVHRLRAAQFSRTWRRWCARSSGSRVPAGCWSAWTSFCPRTAGCGGCISAISTRRAPSGACCCTGGPRVYTYIPDSLRSFVSIDEFSALLRRAGIRPRGDAQFPAGRNRPALGGST